MSDSQNQKDNPINPKTSQIISYSMAISSGIVMGVSYYYLGKHRAIPPLIGSIIGGVLVTSICLFVFKMRDKMPPGDFKN